MRPKKYVNKEKSLRRLYEEYEKLRSSAKGMYVEVEPYQKGWLRHLVLKPTTKLRPDAERVQKAVDLIDTMQGSDNRDFTHRTSKGVREEYLFRPKHITIPEWEQLDESLQKYFEKVARQNQYNGQIYYHYTFRYMNWLEFEYLENIVTHHYIPDGPAESRLAWLKKKLYTENYEQLYKVMGWTRDYRDNDEMRRFKNSYGHEFYEDNHEED